MDTGLDDEERRRLRLRARTATLEALRSLGGEARREDIRLRALADGGFTARELAATPPEKAGANYATLVDHQLAWALTNLKRDELVENPAWGMWRLAGAAIEMPLPAEATVVDAERLARLRTMPYREYLRTPEWRRTRAGALVRAGQACSLDVTHTEDLEVHHRTYERLGAELVGDLIVLCRPCHRLHHRANGRPGRRQPASRSIAPPSPPVRSAGAAAQKPSTPKSLLSRLFARAS